MSDPINQSRVGALPLVQQPPQPDFWVAYYHDFSDVVIFVSELAAYRYALANYMQVAGAKAGRSLREQLPR